MYGTWQIVNKNNKFHHSPPQADTEDTEIYLQEFSVLSVALW